MIETESIVLHAFDYRETSRIVRLATRELGVISAVARGAKRPKSRFGQGLDLFTSGAAHVIVHPTGDLHTLVAFDATRARPALAESLQRFGAAAALGELCLRFGTDAPASLQEALRDGLDALCAAEAHMTTATALGTAWQLAAELGFAPAVERCAVCHSELGEQEETKFAERVGGAICAACYAAAPGARKLPADARLAIRDWLAGEVVVLPDRNTARAHQRLLRGFLEEHLADGRPLKAWAAWELGTR